MCRVWAGEHGVGIVLDTTAAAAQKDRRACVWRVTMPRHYHARDIMRYWAASAARGPMYGWAKLGLFRCRALRSLWSKAFHSPSLAGRLSLNTQAHGYGVNLSGSIMTTCQIPGHASSFGLGIRIAFYLQWFGMIITCWFLESDALNLKFLNGLTVLATSIGLAVNLGVLQPAEIYVVLLLVCGTLYFLVPVNLWRVLTCCHPWWDTERWNRIRMGWLFRTGMALMFGTLLGIQIWFWCTGVHIRPPGTDSSCQQYGFLFGQIRLDSPAFTAINIILHIVMLVTGIWLFCDWIGMFDECRWWRRRKKRRWR